MFNPYNSLKSLIKNLFSPFLMSITRYCVLFIGFAWRVNIYKSNNVSIVYPKIIHFKNNHIILTYFQICKSYNYKFLEPKFWQCSYNLISSFRYKAVLAVSFSFYYFVPLYIKVHDYSFVHFYFHAVPYSEL